MSSTKEIMRDGLWDKNLIFVQMLGMCPLLGVSTSVSNGVGMGLATTAVLIGSNVVIAMARNFIPDEVRIPAFIIIIASFVTIIDLSMNAFAHDLYKILGIYIPLIVVNCGLLGRAEAFASKNTVYDSAVDGLAIGLGFTLGLLVLGGLREIIGSGALFGFSLMGDSFHPALAFVLPPGGFIALGFILMGVRWINQKRVAK